ncbi:MAG: FAD-dependent monooxygenase, partial [Stackebrandtia sp.]
MTSVRVAIVGGGIGGLTVGLALRSVGAEVDVYEQAPALGEVGAGVALAPAGMRVLDRLGVAEAVTRCAAPIGKVDVRRSDGSAMAPPMPGDAGPGTGQPKPGGAGPGMGMGVYRPDLVAALAAALPDGALHTGHRCVTFSQDPGSARVEFDNGVTVEADMIVGADGIHSVLQHHVVEPQPPVFSGRIAYRGVLPAERLPDWPRDAAALWNGEDKRFLTFPVHAGELRNFTGFVPADEEMRESWSASGDPAALAAEFAGWDPRLCELIARIETTFRWGIYDRDPLPHWTRGRLTLLGDAAHAMLPHMGQGANQAIEDAMALATLIRELDTADVPRALISYEQLRRER